MTTLADPQFISWEEWANIAVIELPNDQLLLPPAEAEWKFWATAALKSGSFLGAMCPDPADYDDWRVWAGTCRQLVNG